MDDSVASQGEMTVDLADLWVGLLSGKFFADGIDYREGRCFVTLRTGGPRASRLPRQRAVQVLQRVLAGESQKVVAIELGLSTTTIATYCSNTLRSLGNNHLSSRAPIFLVMAALAHQGFQVPKARVERTRDTRWLVSVDVPGHAFDSLLSPCERDIARAILEGKTNAEIARERRRSTRTVANQLASIFAKLRAHGRTSLRALAITSCVQNSVAA